MVGCHNSALLPWERGPGSRGNRALGDSLGYRYRPAPHRFCCYNGSGGDRVLVSLLDSFLKVEILRLVLPSHHHVSVLSIISQLYRLLGVPFGFRILQASSFHIPLAFYTDSHLSMAPFDWLCAKIISCQTQSSTRRRTTSHNRFCGCLRCIRVQLTLTSS